MGEVYRATDTRLHREVAIKVSAERFSERFEREARAIASLNHPNICSLYDVGPNYLVMELVEGENLKGPVPLAAALDYARQIADALETSHEKGIVHRDLKPGNIRIKPDGTLKVLDFGLAKMGGIPAAASEESPTVTMNETQAGVILGTAAYMAPEQAKGKSVDKRADIWAFGVVLWEMLTGERMFHGETTTEVLASVLKEEPKWDNVPEKVRPLLRRCLEKDPKKRLRDIGEAMVWVEAGAGLRPAIDSAGRRPAPLGAVGGCGCAGSGAGRRALDHVAARYGSAADAPGRRSGLGNLSPWSGPICDQRGDFSRWHARIAFVGKSSAGMVRSSSFPGDWINPRPSSSRAPRMHEDRSSRRMAIGWGLPQAVS